MENHKSSNRSLTIRASAQFASKKAETSVEAHFVFLVPTMVVALPHLHISKFFLPLSNVE
jgi:hypothetical protein